MSRGEFLPFSGCEARAILEQANLRKPAMSVRDIFYACIAEYSYWRSQAARADASTYAGQGYQPSGSARQTEAGQGYE